MVLTWLWTIGVVAVAAGLAAVYMRGWVRLRRWLPRLATRTRLVTFMVGSALAVLALAAPLPWLSPTFMLARSAQKIILCFLAGPLIWLAYPLHVTAFAWPRRVRVHLARWFVRRARLSAPLRVMGNPFVVWFAYLATFALWDDPGIVNATMPVPALRTLFTGWLFLTAMLFWSQIMLAGPQRYAHTGVVGRALMLIGVEAPNLAAGITVAFAAYPIYRYYEEMRAAVPELYAGAMPFLAEQFLSGAITWVFGSLVYIAAIVAVVNQLFKRAGSKPQRPANWDADEKFIAPGLEGRLGDAANTSYEWK
jgi:cytochrome c oxidase assembly factor CtaG